MTPPTELLRCDKMVQNHSDLIIEPSASLRAWSLKIGSRTFIRYRDGVDYSTKNTVKIMWCRIIDDKKAKDSNPAPRTFADTLSRALEIL